MKENVSVDKAIKRGHLIVNFPVLIVIIGIPSLAFYLEGQKLIPKWGIGVAIFIGIGLAWLIWSYIITKWRIWAFENVRNVHELKKRAIQEKLIWNDGSIFEKTEIRNQKDRLRLKKLSNKFDKRDEYREDHLLPKKTKIFYSKSKSYIEFGVSILIISVGVYFFHKGENNGYILGTLMTSIGIFSAIKELKKILNNQPQIIIDKNGIITNNVDFRNWTSISNEEVIQEGYGKSTKYYLIYFYDESTFEKINIDARNVTVKELENIIRTYRIRHQKSQY